MKLTLTLLALLSLHCGPLFGQEKWRYPDIFELKFEDDESYIISLDTTDLESFRRRGHLYVYFKYAGEDTLILSKTFTGDPHFISSYPKGILQKDSVYELQISFFPYPGTLNKAMGFYMSNGKRVTFKVKGMILAEKREEER